MNITIAICTWNRAELLDQTLQGMKDLIIPDSVSWELIIVNNNCTDNTDEIIAKHSDSLPIVRIFEPVPGLSNARNAAVKKASGEYIIWTDDDVLVDQNWLQAYTRAFNNWPDISVFGGPIEPWFEGSPPEWLRKGWQTLSDAYAIRDLGNQFIALQKQGNKLPYGANFAIRMSEQKQFFYNPELGLNHGKILLGEETDVILSIFDAGHTGIWVPDAKVKHWLPKSRQTKSYIKKYYEGSGIKQSRNRINQTSVMLFGIPRWFFRVMIETYVIHVFNRIFRPTEVWISSLKQIYINRGIRKSF